ncbi:MAG: hypothetical protein QOJ52_2453, partial [Acidimicrobiaceae bacterium]|nr:hypothetical protein [Acidimicrobiaceae bacterium]
MTRHRGHQTAAAGGFCAAGPGLSVGLSQENQGSAVGGGFC